MNLFKKHGFAIFWVVATADLALIIAEMEHLRLYTKSLLMPLLLLTVLSRIKPRRHQHSKIIIVSAFLLASFCDVLLLQSETPAYFISGLVSFLLMQLLYTLYFLRIQPFTIKHSATTLFTSVLLAIAAVGFIAMLWNELNEYRIPVIVYAAFLSLMCVSAVNVIHYRVTKRLALEAFIPGAILFFLSDFILATNKFYLKEAFIGIAVMATYCGAQYYIARGFIKHLT